jgi:hypothetical protein
MIMNLASAQSIGPQLAQTILRNFSPAHTVQPIPVRYGTGTMICSTSPTHFTKMSTSFFLWARLNCTSSTFCKVPVRTYSLAVLEAVLWIRKYFFRIRTRGSVILNSGSGRPINYGSGRIRILPEIAG